MVVQRSAQDDCVDARTGVGVDVGGRPRVGKTGSTESATDKDNVHGPGRAYATVGFAGLAGAFAQSGSSSIASPRRILRRGCRSPDTSMELPESALCCLCGHLDVVGMAIKPDAWILIAA
jgi:hypothetical protein